MLRWFHCSAANVLAMKIGNIFTTYRSIESPLLSVLRSFFIHSHFPHAHVCVFVCVCVVMSRFCPHAPVSLHSMCRNSGRIFCREMSSEWFDWHECAECTRLFALFQSVYWQIVVSRHHHYYCISMKALLYSTCFLSVWLCREREREPHICHWYNIEPVRLHNDWNGFGWSSVCPICTAMSGIQHTKKYTRKLASIIYKIDNPSDVI